MTGRGPARRHAARAALAAAIACAAPALAAEPPAYPAFPTELGVTPVGQWLRANTNVQLGAVVGVGDESVFVLEPSLETAPPPALRARLRQEVISDAFARSLGGRSMVMTLDVDCDGGRVFQRALDLYDGNNKRGAVRHLGAGDDWMDVPDGSFIQNAVSALCDPTYQPIYPAGELPTEIAQASPPPAWTPRPAVGAPVGRRLQPSLSPIAPIARSAPPPARTAPPRPAPAAAPPAAAIAASPPPAATPLPLPAPRPNAVVGAAPTPASPAAAAPAPRPAPAPAPAASPPARTAAPVELAAATPPAPPALALPQPRPNAVIGAEPPGAAAPVRTARTPPTPEAAPAPAAPRAGVQIATADTQPPRTGARSPVQSAVDSASSASALGLRPLALGRAELGAYRDADAAIAAWETLEQEFPEVMKGKRHHIELSTAAGGVRFRSFVDGFASRVEAEAYCRQLYAARRTCRATE